MPERIVAGSIDMHGLSKKQVSILIAYNYDKATLKLRYSNIFLKESPIIISRLGLS